MTTNGLEGVVVADTELSAVDGEAGELLLRGLPVGEVAGVLPFEEVCRLLWEGGASKGASVDLGPARVRAYARLGSLGDALSMPDAMDALRAAMAHLTIRPDGGFSESREEIVAAVAVYAAAWSRRTRGLDPIAPDASLAHAADYLRMVHGTLPNPRAVAAMDAYFATVVDHGMNASTFAARVIASTESDLVSAVVGAIGALKGRLHGGAPGPVLDMLDAVGTPDRAEAYVDAQLARGERLMGMGHRVYKVRDPRAAVLERAVEALGEDVPDDARLALARAVERAAVRALEAHKPGRRLRANVEFYTAVLLEALGLPRTLFTATFACARAAGWCAHYAEQRATGRLIRPAARYVGPRPA